MFVNGIVEKIERSSMNINYWEDGKTHINLNISNPDKNVQKLNDITYNPFVHPVHGSFNCLRSIYYWLTLDNPPESIRVKYGNDYYKGVNKKQTRQIKKYDLYKECVEMLLATNSEFKEAFLNVRDLNLPLVSYTYFESFYRKNHYQRDLIKVYKDLMKESRRKQCLI